VTVTVALLFPVVASVCGNTVRADAVLTICCGALEDAMTASVIGA